jgi:L-alanine-DL-glutamate epimerase-like enolase superfamily enzyme
MSEGTRPARRGTDPTVERIEVDAYEIPTDRPESDGTFEWTSTTIVVVHAHGAGQTGLGYTYGPAAVADVVSRNLASTACGRSALAPQVIWRAARAGLRNAGQAGIGALALSALDLALHDLRARLLGVPLSRALGAARDCVPVYGSGGFTTYGPQEVAEQLGGWVAEGIPRVKMKVARDPEADRPRLEAAREAIAEAELMVDANGVFTPQEAIEWTRRYAEYGVVYFEEPVSSDDLAGMRRVRDAASGSMAIAAGEYCWSALDARRMLDAGSVDILQADVTRCGGLTGLVQIDALCAASGRPFSAHCAPAITAHAGCALHQLVHLEYFHDHVRIEGMLFDGVIRPHEGVLRPDPDVPGNGLTLRRADAEPHRVWP